MNSPICRSSAARSAVEEDDRKRKVPQRLTVAERSQAIAQVLDVGLLRFVDELIALRDLVVPHLGDEAGLRNIEVPAAGIDFLAGLRRRQRRPLGHNVEVGGNLEELVEHEGPGLADGLFHREHAHGVVAHAEMIALGLDVRVDHLVVEKLVRARLARDPPVIEVDEPPKEREGCFSALCLDGYQVRELAREIFDALGQLHQVRIDL